MDHQEYPRVMYRGAYDPAMGLGNLQTVTVGSASEEKEQAKDGFVCHEDLDSLIPEDRRPKPEAKPKKSQKDVSEE